MGKTNTANMTSGVKKIALTKEIGISGIFGLIGILFGSFSMLGTFNPVGIAYIMTFAGEGTELFLAVATVSAGFVLRNNATFVSDYAVSILLCTVYGFIKGRSNKNVTAGEKGLAAFIIFLLSGLIRGIIEHDIRYLLLISLLEGLVIFGLVYVFDRGVSALKTTSMNKSIEKNDIIGLVMISAFSVAGASCLYKGVIPIHIILGFFIILTVGYLFGTEFASAAGIILSASLLAARIIDIKMFAILCMTGFICGLMGKNGKLSAALSCLAVSVIFEYYFQILTISLVLGVCAACIMFMISAERLANGFSISDAEGLSRSSEHYAGMRNYISGKLNGYARGLIALEKSFSPEKNHSEKVKKETGELIDKVACMVCEDCRLCQTCWNNSYYNTYQTLLTLFSVCEKKGMVHTEDLPAVFRDYCIKQDDFAEAVNVTYSGHREGLLWNMKLMESRQLAMQQMNAMAEMMTSLADEIENRIYFKENLEKVIYYELRKTSSNIDKVTVEEGENGEYEVAIYRHGCNGRQECREKTIDTVSSILGRKMKRMEKECSTDINGRCKLLLCEKYNFRVSSAAAMAIKDEENISGDSYSFMELPKGGYMIALSDGMGSGKAAGDESRTVIELLEQFAEAGFKRELALKMINSVLVMGTDDESFATLDMCYIDLYSGTAEFIKTGAAATFVIRDGKAKAIRSSSLPIGMLKYFDMDRAEYKLHKNDIILMLTDGAAEVIERENMSTRILTELMAENSMKDPKDIAEYVLESLKERSGFRIQDDMTVVAARVWG